MTAADPGLALRAKVAAAVADILAFEGGIPKDTAQLIMDKLTDGLTGVPRHVLLGALAELQLVTDIREPYPETDGSDTNEH